ncbi:MAG: type I glyceraldehyde-3-phosphate dehydrogenase [SAR202 cluster bacterium]|nr:type I glyceraldehyde-3-phosphate dehydrogenase [SAR202 cluster bacterium]|tara:strand:+ start:3305 stop:4318 length:1014 start_codon:yes stop_codon:yes gene_type:complete
MKARIGINGFGRIGRLVLRAVIQEGYKDIEVGAINSFADPESNAHMFKYDTTYGTFKGDVNWTENSIVIDGHPVVCLNSESPSLLPWEDHGVDIVIECTGKFTDSAKASGHLEGGAKKVIITAPAKNEDITIVLGVNEHQYDKTNHHIISNASCTTNCAAPLMKVLDDSFGIEQGMMTTIHSYTNDQQVLDKRHKDKRRARAAAMNIIPTTTGAAKAVGQVIPNLEGKVHGMAFRVPTATVSVTDFVATLKTRATAEEINLAYQEVSQNRLNGILEYSNEPLVSSDYRESKYSCTIDGLSTITLDTNMAKVVGWYDNEWGYSCRTVELAKLVAEAGF